MGMGGVVCVQYVPGMEPITNLFAATFYMALVGLIFAILALAALVSGIFKPNARYALVATGLVSSILLMVAAIYIYVALPGVFNGGGGASPTEGEELSGFFGHLAASSGGSSLDVNYGGGLGWYAALLAFLLLFAGTIIGTTGINSVRYPRPEWGPPVVPTPPYATSTPPEPTPPFPQVPPPLEPNPTPEQPSTPKPEGPPAVPPTPPETPMNSPKTEPLSEDQPQ